MIYVDQKFKKKLKKDTIIYISHPSHQQASSCSIKRHLLGGEAACFPTMDVLTPPCIRKRQKF
jgi:hypothetical protein